MLILAYFVKLSFNYLKLTQIKFPNLSHLLHFFFLLQDISILNLLLTLSTTASASTSKTATASTAKSASDAEKRKWVKLSKVNPPT